MAREAARGRRSAFPRLALTTGAYSILFEGPLACSLTARRLRRHAMMMILPMRFIVKAMMISFIVFRGRAARALPHFRLHDIWLAAAIYSLFRWSLSLRRY